MKGVTWRARARLKGVDITCSVKGGHLEGKGYGQSMQLVARGQQCGEDQSQDTDVDVDVGFGLGKR